LWAYDEDELEVVDELELDSIAIFFEYVFGCCAVLDDRFSYKAVYWGARRRKRARPEDGAACGG
jgi:hypothetical protein